VYSGFNILHTPSHACPGPFGEYIGLPWVLSDLYMDIDPSMYVKEWLQPRKKVNERHMEIYGWEIDWSTMGKNTGKRDVVP
jgi:hypothetical protein